MITPRTIKKFIGVAKIAGPLVAPYALKALGQARDAYDRLRAHRLGVPVEQLSQFSGRGAALHARIAGDASALRDLRQRASTGHAFSEEDRVTMVRFADSAEERLTELTSAVRAAERMPTARRRSVHKATEGELNRIEDDLIQRFLGHDEQEHAERGPAAANATKSSKKK